MNKIQRVAAVHDLSGFGKASLTAVIPILSTLGIQVCPLPTAVLSSISEFPRTRMIDLTDSLDDILSHWRELNLRFDAIYSGFLGSSRQVGIVQQLIKTNSTENCLIVIDPVMGDNGKLYHVFTSEIINSMQQLIKSAQVITPNSTEAAFLLNEPQQSDMNLNMITDWLLRLADMGPDIVIITSMPDCDNERNTCVYAYDKPNNDLWKIAGEYLPGNYPGTGDTFASIITGCLLKGESLPIAIEKAVNFIYIAIAFSLDYITDNREGIYLEAVLPELLKPVGKTKIKKLNIEHYA